jgi:hypothetical protein
VWVEAFSLSGVGLLAGVRHALEPDHLAAVSAMAAANPTPRATLRYALLWGAGHAAVLLVAGGTMFALRSVLPIEAERGLEVIIALSLVALGLRACLLGHKPQLHAHATTLSAPARARVHAPIWLPIGMGLLHGFAGSGAVGAAVLAAGCATGAGLVSIALYAAGSLAGMSALAGLLGRPLAYMSRHARSRRYLAITSGLFSVAVGAIWFVVQLRTV